ncbi:MAG: hypothetical protein ABJB12_14455 [Pseudomonadota bacterium]
MKTPRIIIITGACVLALACSSQKSANQPGPAQRAGASVDEGAEKAKQSAKEAGKKVGDATEKAGEKIDEKTHD